MTDDGWFTLNVERALYADRGRDAILCDRLPSPTTLVVKISNAERERLKRELLENADK